MRCLSFSATLITGAVASVLLAIGASEPARAGDFTLTLDGSQVYERLEPTDNYLVEDNSYIDTYTFTGRAGQRVIITMTSQEVDSYLILLDANGNSIVQDDDSAGGLDARIDTVLPADGTYTVYANTYRGGTFGSYTLQASTSGSTATPVVTNPSPFPNTFPNTNPDNEPSVATQSRYFCDSSGDTPLTMARSRRTGDVFPLIQWSSDWAPAPFSPDERCRAVSARLADIHDRFDRLILTSGTLNNQPVVCAASSREEARQGFCAADGLIVTTQSRTASEDLIRGLQSSFTRIVAGTSPDILPASSAIDDGNPYIDISDF